MGISGGGDPWLLFWALPAINLAAIGGLAWLGVRLARHFGVNVWWGFVLPLAVNDGMALLRDLTDPLATFTVCGLLAAWLLRDRDRYLGLWAAAALFSREQNVAVVLVVLAATVWTRRYKASGVLIAAVGTWSAWVCVLHSGYGDWPVLPRNDYFFGTPFKGMWFRWTHLSQSGSRLSAGLHFLRHAPDDHPLRPGDLSRRARPIASFLCSPSVVWPWPSSRGSLPTKTPGATRASSCGCRSRSGWRPSACVGIVRSGYSLRQSCGRLSPWPPPGTPGGPDIYSLTKM